ncbi:hypothetical protein BDY19DRAFT_1076687 [Irpex rosettiformis]|uniref:Uncharacterized protein n=1 Tax=Irpex rosettiformis TaxID=378272 RepID=A0ACB8TSV8_9APHY|nr:hypothetical protein BDY19DRAFT_1076687 [Irpex rosettiformis]
MREYANVRLRARDLPHRMQDYLNTLPPFVNRAQDYKRTIFKAMIRSNTAEIEPCAPEIDIINSVDDEQCPPLEFYYTNYMWHSDSVPTLDASKLKGCGCYPVCLPDSKCSCLKRQQDFYDETMSGFNYSQGRLKYEEYPIFECNALCGCDEDCRNRVVQHGRKHAINIEKTKEKGWGVFAAEHIPAKTFVGIYSGEFITDVEGETRGKIYHLGSRTYLFDIDFWHLKKGKEDWEVKYCVDAFHAGNFTRYLNHSCEPNCLLVPVYINEPDLEKPMLAIFTSKDVYVHQELCFSYFGPPDGEQEEDVSRLLEHGFVISYSK